MMRIKNTYKTCMAISLSTRHCMSWTFAFHWIDGADSLIGFTVAYNCYSWVGSSVFSFDKSNKEYVVDKPKLSD